MLKNEANDRRAVRGPLHHLAAALLPAIFFPCAVPVFSPANALFLSHVQGEAACLLCRNGEYLIIPAAMALTALSGTFALAPGTPLPPQAAQKPNSTKCRRVDTLFND